MNGKGRQLVVRRCVLPLSLVVLAPCGGFCQTWPETLPAHIARRILWSADHENGNTNEWTDVGFRHHGGGIFNTGGAAVSAKACRAPAHSGNWAVKAEITGAFRSQNGNRAVRLMRWTDKAWDDGGTFFPSKAYFSTWIYIPHIYNPNKYAPWDPGDGGWWNIFQFKSNDRNGKSQPMWTVDVGHNDTTHQMYLYLYSDRNQPSSYGQTQPRWLPVRKWFHLEAYYASETEKKGRITVWQDGAMIFDVPHVITSLGGKNGKRIAPDWGIGNYTDHIVGDPAGAGQATIYFDDAIVSTVRVSQTRR